ncbi:MAG: glycosyltransferase [Saprospiraceae bacterium]|nr:glycosyltransferase [Saprospiraceae bacterium]
MVSAFLLVLIIASTLIQLAIWTFVIRNPAGRHPGATDYDRESVAVSVIICARNEASNLKQNLPLILGQNYPSFEVIVVNDNSTDQTAEVLDRFSKHYRFLRVLEMKVDRPGKKHALVRAVGCATNDWILLTDADCWPSSSHWIHEMVAPFNANKMISLGMAPLLPGSTFMSHFSSYDSILTSALYISAAQNKSPYMGVGRNVGYHRSIFNDLPDHYFEFVGGDDDLLINHVATGDNCAVVTSSQSLILSHSPSSCRGFLDQRARHLSVSSMYKLRHKTVLVIFALSHWIHLFAVLALLFTGYWWLAMALYIIRILCILVKSHDYLLLADWHHKKHLVPVFDLVYIIYHPINVFFLFSKPEIKWI